MNIQPQSSSTQNSFNYLLSSSISGHEIIPSDIFVLGASEYVVLSIQLQDNEHWIHALGIRGEHTGNIYMIPRDVFPELTDQGISYFQHD